MSRFLHIASVLASLTVATASVRANPAAQREDQFKAAYVFNFVKFVEWPGDAPGDSLTVCFVGAEGVYAALATGIANKRVGQRSLAAMKVTEPPADGTCDALYIEASKASGYALPGGAAVLTISDAANFTANGGMVGLFTENHRLRFTIHLDNAQRAGLRISSDLLKLAASVRRDAR